MNNGNSSSRTIRVIFQALSLPEFAGDALRIDNGSTLHLEGSYVKLIWDLRDALDLNLQLLFQDENDLDWRPPVKLVAEGNADLGAMPISQNYYWQILGLGSKFVFLHAIISEKFDLYFRQPFHKDYPSILLRPFQLDVWIAILIIVGVSVLIMEIMKRASSKENYIYFQPNDISVGFLMQVTTLILGRISPSSISGKISIQFIVLTLLTSFLLILYNANLISTFSNDDGHLIKHQNDLITFGYTFTTWGDYSIDRLYDKSVHDKLAKQPFIQITGLNVQEMTKKVISPLEKGKYALLNHAHGVFIGGAFSGMGMNREYCSVMSFSSVRKYPRSMVIRKDSPLREVINQKLLLFNERGLKFRHHSRFLNRIEYKCVPNQVNLIEITNEHVSFAYYVLIGGAIIAIIIEFLNKLRFNSNKVN